MKRLIIYPKDIQRITGKSASGARRELRRIKKILGRNTNQYVTFEEYAYHSGLTLPAIAYMLDLTPSALG
ncbi:hypothetical protein FUAX_55330 (plasmid) [Fulvitalea axinellae]|uniref:Uncharacterized protein n=1 Tax=Fulvitalea axinellae TaxID=1182444 RepID=A0AAU9CMB2_9BACT|nr:hypothetical protein FUAX_55330 [Fulvitalea axinellae]